MLLAAFNKTVLSAAMALLPHNFDTPQARVMLVAIGLQESELCYHIQCNGPAHGLWQFEQVGIQGVFDDPRTHDLALAVCQSMGIDPTASAVYAELPQNDILAAAFARLCLWSDPQALPALGDVNGSWDCYIRNWRPGKPRLEAWPVNYSKALAAIQGETSS